MGNVKFGRFLHKNEQLEGNSYILAIVMHWNFKNTIGGMCFSRRTILILRSSSAARKEAGFLLLWLIFFPAFLRLLFNAINYGTAAERS